MRGIVVGIDDSEPSRRALAWAVEQAKLRNDVPLTVVHAYRPRGHRGAAGSSYPTMRDPYVPAETMVQVVERQQVWLDEEGRIARSQAENLVGRAVASVAAELGEGRIQRHVVEREPGKALVELSRGADLLVVGHRGRGGLAGIRLGSVASRCVHHAACPVVVVR